MILICYDASDIDYFTQQQQQQQQPQQQATPM